MLFILLGMLLGAMLALLLSAGFVFAFPFITGSGGDEMSQGIMATLATAVTAPVLGLVGAIWGYRLAK